MLGGAIFGAYRIHDFFAARGNPYAIGFGFGFAVLGILAITAFNNGAESIIPDVHLLVTVLLAYIAAKWTKLRYGESISIAIAAGIVVLSIGIGIVIGIDHSSRCYTDWDGRSNPTVCD